MSSSAGPLPPSPAALTATRTALHRLATYVVAPVRYAATERFGLRSTPGGFGTPDFDGRQIRVQGTMLHDQRGDEVKSAPITSLGAAAAFLETTVDAETAAEHDSPAVGDVDADLAIDLEASEFLGAWFAMAFAALEQVQADERSVDASSPQLWPGHFDPAIEVGDDDHRGSYGASPGDQSIDEPYLYVSLWWPDRLTLDENDPLLNAPSFRGAVLRLSEFADAQDPAARAVEFFTSIRDHITQ